MDRLLLAKARQEAKAAGAGQLVQFRVEDAMKVDLSKADVVTLYMLPWFNEAMKTSFQKFLQPGARIVAHDFGIEGWAPDKTIKLPNPEKKVSELIHYHTLHLWRIGKDKIQQGANGGGSAQFAGAPRSLRRRSARFIDRPT